MKYKRYRKISIYLLIIAIFLTVGANAFAEEETVEDNFDDVIDINEEKITLPNGMEIYPNLNGSEFEQVQINQEPELELGERMGGPLVEVKSAPAGGPYVGYLSGDGYSNVNVYSASTGGTALTYINDHYRSGVFPILGESGSRYKIAISGVIGWIPKSGVTLVKFNPDTIAHDFYQVENGQLIHLTTSDPVNLWYSKINQGDAPSYLGKGQYMSWDGHYFYPATYNGFGNLINDYNAGHRNNSVNINDPFYNYFQWLPARTQTVLNEDIFEQYLLNNGYNTMRISRLLQTGKLFMDNGNYFGGNAALGFAMAVHESGWGGIAGFSPNRNNFFGHDAYDSSPGMASRYPTPNYGIGIHFGSFWNWNYLNTAEYPGSVFRGGALGDKGTGMNVKYASDPYWGEKIAAHYYNIDKLAPANKRDYKRYTLATIDDVGVNLRKDASTDSGIVYQTKHLKNTIAIIDEKNGTKVSDSTLWYGFTAEPILTSNKDLYPYKDNSGMGEVPVNIHASTIYIHSSFTTVVSEGYNSTLVTQPKVNREKTPTISKTGMTLYALKSADLKVDTTGTRDTILTVPKDAKITGYKTDDGYVQVLYDTGEKNPYIKDSTIHFLGYIHQSKVSTSKNGTPLNGGTVEPDPLPQPGNTSRYVTADVGLHLREKPSGTSRSLGLIAKDTEVKSGTPLNGWVHATVGGKSGYMAVDYLTTTKPSKPDPKPDPDPLPKPGNTTMYTTDGVNMRKTPGDGTVIVLVPKGAAVKTGTAVNGWVHATYNGYSGYMSADYLTKTKPTPPDPVTRLLGDVNGDGKIDGFDMMAIKRHHLGIKKLSGLNFRAADVNGDGKVDGFDMMAVKRHHLGIKKIQGVVK